MKYFKIYHRNCRVAKAYNEMTEDQFNAEIDNYADENATWETDEDGNLDFDKLDQEQVEIIDRVKEEAESEDGFDYGDYNLYIRDDDFDMYDIPRI